MLVAVSRSVRRPLTGAKARGPYDSGFIILAFALRQELLSGRFLALTELG